jgi:hypothetical protein
MAYLVPGAGLEPALGLTQGDFKSSAALFTETQYSCGPSADSAFSNNHSVSSIWLYMTYYDLFGAHFRAQIRIGISFTTKLKLG